MKLTPRTKRRRPAFETLSARRLLAAVEIADDLTAAPAAVVSVPVDIDDAVGVRGAEIRLSYDTDVLDLEQADVSVGSVWDGSSDAQLTVNVDDASGTAIVFVAASSDLASGAGSLVELNFTVDSDATLGSTTTLDLTSVVLNEGQIDVTPTPVAGADSTDGTLTIIQTGSDTISGAVFADANDNDSLDSGEAIPGVTITLTDTATGTQQQTVTAADGTYQFSDLAAGTYTITQQQPVAYLDGGQNEVTATLSAGEALEGQDFVEIGLHPAYLYNRLFTTLVLPVGSDAWTSQIERINTDAETGSEPTAPTPTAAATMMASIAGETSSAAAVSESASLTTASDGEGEQVQAFTETIVASSAHAAALDLSSSGSKERDEDLVDQVHATTPLW
ncbi:cohesin domain-containing protein [Rhodopirellula sp. JC639]|uniref:cohesin domain-containing protein n=1 Tax=Stieleria mannarensis TaxID=2755585 RepID=UPI00160426C3|nr:cohesin domain-containing protein [Rhodopirellula sp. JC639]